MPRFPRRWRTAVIGTAAVLALSLQYGVAQAAPQPGKIDSALSAALGQGPATFLVHLKGGADLSTAAKAATKDDKATQVFKAKTTHATRSQAGLRDLLRSTKATFTPFWIVNAVKVTGDAGLAASIAKLPEVERIEPDRVIPLWQPLKGRQQPKVAGVEWNLDRIGAPRVWSEYGTRGEGVVVANIDSGVEFDHPALAAQYRGRKTGGAVDHTYNWFDATAECAGGTPCDANGHGTHTMGTMVGASGADTVGVAPGAKWMAAKACGLRSCEMTALLAAGQWLIAPTDRDGLNPRPDLAPDIVNNSWSGPTGDPWYRSVVDAWVAAGIFPAFANGNSGPGCYSTGSPGHEAGAYSTGAFDLNNQIAGFSSRGPGADGQVKPDIAAPGVDVRSSTPGGGYGLMSGTSMASPHVAGTVALMWSASPGLKGDVGTTKGLLDRTAVDVGDTTCGGTATKNGVWGEGRLDAYAAVRGAPGGEVGGISGTITSGGAPLELVTVTFAGPLDRTVVTGKDGTYTLPRLLAGDYRVGVRRAGYSQATATVTVTAGRTSVHDVALTAQPVHTVSGVVATDMGPEAGVTVNVAGTTTSAVTDAAGRYSLSVEGGEHKLRVTPRVARCAASITVPISVPVTVNGEVSKDITVPRRTDSFGYGCAVGTDRSFPSGTNRLPVTVHGQPSAPFSLPFRFPFYDQAYSGGQIGFNGWMSFAGNGGWRDSALPSPGAPNAAIYPLWDEFQMDERSGVYTALQGSAPSRTFIVEWRDLYFHADPSKRVSFSALLGENGSIRFHYRGITTGVSTGITGTVGIENADGTGAFQFSHNQVALADGQTLTITPGRHGLLTGTVTDAGDGKPVAGATVKAGDAILTTGEDGTYLGYAPVGDQRVEISREHYGTTTQNATVSLGAWTRLDASLVTGSVSASVREIDLTPPTGTAASRTVTLTNVGTSAAAFTVTTAPARGWLTATPANGQVAPGASVDVTVGVSSAGVQPGTYRTGKVVVRSASGRAPQVEIPVTMAVPKWQTAVDAGGTREIADSYGDRWVADRAYSPGGYGYMGTRTKALTTTRTIRGTRDEALFKTAREAMTEYRFDNVPVGVYTVELGFAETRTAPPGRHVFDVLAEGRLAMPMLDIAQEAGADTATVRRYTVKVADGQLNLRFTARTGTPIVNTIRITERPDKTAP
ncbi:S8 family serine peptidase [Sinosporangium siamense]|uniref:alpha-amylase n=1 Tax=Sinosporangium siamense TaxID=1367973 RepID=A0A919V966_9ACTN|nr:S8 family serine peptidase [Sinosporangium siamense]GII94981.1 hypothetical protein Ssi02_52120 [Sinosporangium siamense]